MIQHLKIKLACARIIQRKREKNRAMANEQKQPNHQLISTFDELEKEVLGASVSVEGSLRLLESTILEMIKARKLYPVAGGFCTPETMKDSKSRAEKHWSENTTKPILK